MTRPRRGEDHAVGTPTQRNGAGLLCRQTDLAALHTARQLTCAQEPEIDGMGSEATKGAGRGAGDLHPAPSGIPILAR